MKFRLKPWVIEGGQLRVYVAEAERGDSHLYFTVAGDGGNHASSRHLENTDANGRELCSACQADAQVLVEARRYFGWTESTPFVEIMSLAQAVDRGGD